MQRRLLPSRLQMHPQDVQRWLPVVCEPRLRETQLPSQLLLARDWLRPQALPSLLQGPPPRGLQVHSQDLHRWLLLDVSLRLPQAQLWQQLDMDRARLRPQALSQVQRRLLPQRLHLQASLLLWWLPVDRERLPQTQLSRQLLLDVQGLPS